MCCSQKVLQKRLYSMCTLFRMYSFEDQLALILGRVQMEHCMLTDLLDTSKQYGQYYIWKSWKFRLLWFKYKIDFILINKYDSSKRKVRVIGTIHENSILFEILLKQCKPMMERKCFICNVHTPLCWHALCSNSLNYWV